MEPFREHTGRAAVLNRANIDTDQIIPKQFLKRVERTGFGRFLFFDWRFAADGAPNPEFELNQPKAQGATVLVAGKNFGSGSSREHAPWALLDYGFRVIIAPSFADIFYNNCFENGILPITLPEADVQRIMELAALSADPQIHIDLQAQTVSTGDYSTQFEIDPFRKHRLLNGLDSIGLTLQHASDIDAYEASLPAWKQAYCTFPTT
jgi:3-isopropylmalate/(R)-2-methylmalate dehydratase small subunit